MRLRYRLIFIFCFLSLLIISCSTRQGSFTILSTKNAEISRVDLKRIDFSRNTTGTDGRFWFLFIPFSSTPKLEEACDRCLEAGNGDFMTNAVLYHTSWHVLLFGYDGWEIKGDVGNSISKGAADLKSRKEE